MLLNHLENNIKIPQYTADCFFKGITVPIKTTCCFVFFIQENMFFVVNTVNHHIKVFFAVILD